MDKFKFKAWITKHKKMAEICNINLITKKITCQYSILKKSEPRYEKKTLNIKDVKLLQYTGLKDINGTEICEGDILQRKFWDHRDTNSIIVCKSCSTGFCLTKISRYEYRTNRDRRIIYRNRYSIINLKICEIIGNIYENEDILKEYTCLK